eukprot:5244155-Amphidinium_carterae.1
MWIVSIVLCMWPPARAASCVRMMPTGAVWATEQTWRSYAIPAQSPRGHRRHAVPIKKITCITVWFQT